MSTNHQNDEKGDSCPLFIMKEIRGTHFKLEVFSLRHPRTGKGVLFAFNQEDETLQELLTFSPKYRSCFIGDSVRSDGSFHFCTPMDPLFLILPYVYKATASSPLYQLLQDDDFPHTVRLDSLKNVRQRISLISDEIDKRWNALRYSRDKTMLWLKEKVKAVATALKSRRVNISVSSAVSDIFVRSSTEDYKFEAYMQYAYGIVSDYLPAAVSEDLYSYLGFPKEDPIELKKRKNGELAQENIKKLKKECLQNEISSKLFSQGSQPEKVVTRKSAKESALAKAATGSKSIHSFFKKK